jgi:GT2 family glycosyltransferase
VQFPVAYNDIDLSLKIGAAGYRLVYTPHASLYHFEAFSKTAEDMDPRPAETAAL